MDFDRKGLIENIYLFAKERNIKIGALEQKVGVSPGYLSRLMKDDSKGNFTVDLLCKISKELDMSLDLLVYSSPNKLSEDEKTFIEFVDKLRMDTNELKLEWEKMSASIQDPTYIFEHPLFRKVETTGEDEEGNLHTYNEMVYESHFLKPDYVKISDNCFHALLDKYKSTEIHIMHVLYHDPHDLNILNNLNDLNLPLDLPVRDEETLIKREKEGFLELYFITKNVVEPIACTKFVSNEVSDAIWHLYNCIKNASSHLMLNSNILKTINDYMKG